ncbi:MAG: hypothetical protein AAB152_04115 [Candidatus Coatesbacteria bacterium]
MLKQFGIRTRPRGTCTTTGEPLRAGAEELRRLYWEEKLSSSEIARKFNTTWGAVRHAFNRYGIPRRARSEAIINGLVRRASASGHSLPTREQMIHWMEEGLSAPDIGRRTGFNGDRIRERLKAFGLFVPAVRAWTRKEVREAVALRRSGRTRREISGAIRRPLHSVDTLFNRMLRHGKARFVHPRWKPEEDALLREERADDQELARRLRRTPGAVKCRRRELGMRWKPRWTEEDIGTAIALRKEGLLCGEIGVRLGRSSASLEGLFHRLGRNGRVALYSRSEIGRIGAARAAPHVWNRWTDEQNELLASLRAQGRLVREIAPIVGKTPSAVQGRLNTIRRKVRRAERPTGLRAPE